MSLDYMLKHWTRNPEEINRHNISIMYKTVTNGSGYHKLQNALDRLKQGVPNSGMEELVQQSRHVYRDCCEQSSFTDISDERSMLFVIHGKALSINQGLMENMR